MYTGHFGLTELPFSITPDPRYLYMSEAHREALAHLLYGIGEGGGFVQLTGEVGTGKTTLCRCLLEQLPPRVDVAFILNPKLTDGAADESKARYAFVCGDFRRIHRTALIACVYRASEWRHKAVELAAHDLLQYLDSKTLKEAS